MEDIIATLKYIHPEKDIRNSNNYGWGIFKFCLVLAYFIYILYNLYVIFFILISLVIFCSWGIFYVKRKIKEEKASVIGYVSFTKTQIICNSFDLGSEKINLNEIVAIQLHFNYVKGKIFVHKGGVDNGLASLMLTYKSGSSIELKFILETTGHYEQLKQLLIIWYKSGIEIKEYYGNAKRKTILLQLNWTYQELQDLKAALGVSGFYNS